MTESAGLIKNPSHGGPQPELLVRYQDGQIQFKVGMRLHVSEREAAVLFRNGQALDAFGPGRHTLTYENVPLLWESCGATADENEPLVMEAYFVSTAESEGGWGTPSSLWAGTRSTGIAPMTG